MSAKAKIIYSGFGDVPSAFVVLNKERQFLFMRGRFDETLDDYPDTYEVFTLPNLSEDKEIEFDPMHRVWIDTKLIDAYMAPVFVGELSLRLWLAREGREHPEVERARRHRIG